MKTFSVGLLLAYKAIGRTSLISKGFIVLIMAMTFLNLLVVRGVLVGIPDSSLKNVRADEVGDVLVSRVEGKNEIEQSYQIFTKLEQDSRVLSYSPRYRVASVLESDYGRTKKQTENASKRSVIIFGFNPEQEQLVTGFDRFIIEGQGLRSGDSNKIVLGKGILSTYATPGENFTDEELLQNVYVGDKILVTVSGQSSEYEVVGISSNKGQADNRAYITDTQARLLLGKTNPDTAEIAVRLEDGVDLDEFADGLRDQFGEKAKVETYIQATGEFLDDIKTIFDYLSGFIGIIGVFIASITIFIVIFINAMSRKKEIGIMRAIGVQPGIIMISYIMQSLFYALSGIVLALVLFGYFIEPYFLENPIDFPFTDVFLAVDNRITLIYVGILSFAAFLAGFIPSRIVLKQKILALILGR